MKTQDDVDRQTATTSSSPEHSKGNRWLTGLIVLLVIVLVVGASAVVFAQFAARQGHFPSGNGTGTIAPPAGQWASVLSGYEISSLVAARSNPAVLYLCATPRNSTGSSSTVTYTVLRSSDFGTHWQNVGSKAGLGNSCQVAVNPANSDDVYVVGAPAAGSTASIAASYMLWHSSNGGQTWTVILPRLHTPAVLTSTPWQVQQIRIEGGNLYGVEAFPASPGITPRGSTQPVAVLPMTRLVMSVDGGHNWTVVDSQFIPANQGVRDYAIDPTNTRTMYELVGVSFLAPRVQPSDTHAEPAFSYNVSLYKTTDGGAIWHLLLENLPFTSQLQLATDNPQVLYIGGAVGPIPYVAEIPTASYAYPAAFGLFQLRVSTGGGVTWKMATSATQVLLVKGWFVSPDGRAFLATAGEGSILPHEQATPVTTPLPASLLLKSYDPATNTWSDVTTTPASGVLFALTPSKANGGAVLWLLSSNNVSSVLLRYVV